MPRYRSVNGKWYPEKEQYINSQADDPSKAVYSGPDRAAKQVLEELGVEYLGQDCRLQEETTIKARNLGCQDADEYLKRFKGVDLTKQEKEQKEKLDTEVFNANRGEKKTLANPVKPSSGGDDTSGQGKHKAGGFGDPDELPSGFKR